MRKKSIAATSQNQRRKVEAKLLAELLHCYLHLPFFTAASCAAQAPEKSGAVATRAQPVPIGLMPLFHQIRQRPSSKRVTEKSARAGVEAAKPSANTPTAKTKRFIVSSLLCLPGNFPIVRTRISSKP